MPSGSKADPGAHELVEQGRAAYAKRAWLGTFEPLSAADGITPLGADDLERLATAAYMLGHDDDQVRLLERASHEHVEAGNLARAAYCAIWIGFNRADRRELGPASGWFQRAQRLVDRHEGDCVEHGYLLLPVMLQQAAGGDLDGCSATAVVAAEIAVRFGDLDLFALSTRGRDASLLAQGQIEEGLALLDEAMVAVTAGELSPIVSGLVYCGVIVGCQEVYELRRAHEWTTALTAGATSSPTWSPSPASCLVHRAEMMQLRGSWRGRAGGGRSGPARFASRIAATGRRRRGLYRQGELHRLRGELRRGRGGLPRGQPVAAREPQPGLALLRLAQGDAAPRPRRSAGALGETAEPRRARAAAPRVRRDHARGRRHSRQARERLRGARGDRRRPRERHARARWPRTPAARSQLAAGDARAALVVAAARRAGVAGARGALRGGAGARAGRAGLPGAR